MKKLVLSLVVMVVCSFQSAIGQSKKGGCVSKCDHSTLKRQSVLFEKGKLYEIAYADIIQGKSAQLNLQYFPKAMPLMVKYGAKMVGGFEVVKNESNNFPANMVAIFEWPNPEARLSLLADKEFKKIVHLRDEALKSVQLGYFQVSESKEITFESNKVYEFGAADLVKGGFEKLKEYNEIAEPIKRSYGGAYPEFVLNFERADSKGQATYVPQMQFIVEWASLEDNESLFENKEFQEKAVPLLMAAVDKFDAVFTKFSFN